MVVVETENTGTCTYRRNLGKLGPIGFLRTAWEIHLIICDLSDETVLC